MSPLLFAFSLESFMTPDQMAAQGALDFLGGAVPIAAPNVAALGYLPQSLIAFTSGPNQGKLRYKEWFTYNVEFNTIGAGATLTNSANVQNDSDFVWMERAATITDAAGTTFTAIAAAALTMRIFDAASGRSLSNVATHINNWFGSSGSPQLSLGVPYTFRRGGQIQVEMANASAGALLVRLSFLGFKVYDVPAE